MSTPSNIPTLTKYAEGIFQETAAPLADFIAPVVVTGNANFLVNDYTKDASFQVPNAKRALGGEGKSVKTDGGQKMLNLDPYSLIDFIDEHEMSLAGDQGAAMQLLRQARTKNLISQAGNSRLASTLAVARAGISATAKTWSGTTDPVADIDDAIKAISDKLGMMPNKMAFSLGAWSIFRNNDKVIARQPGASIVGAQSGTVSAMLLNPNMNIEIGTPVFGEAPKGAGNKTNALANEVWVFFSSPSSDQFDPGFMKTFRVKGNAFDSIGVEKKTYGEKLVLKWAELPYIGNAQAAVRLTVT